MARTIWLYSERFKEITSFPCSLYHGDGSDERSKKGQKIIFEKLHRAINSFNKAFNWRQFLRDALHLGESLLVFGILYGIFSTVIWGVCWIFKINYDPDLVAIAWAVPVLLDTLVNKAYDWNNEIRRWD